MTLSATGDVGYAAPVRSGAVWRRVALLLLGVSCAGAPSLASAQGVDPARPLVSTVAPAQTTFPEDVRSADAIVAALYASISGPAGQPRAWDRFRGLFLPEARLIVARARRDSIGNVRPLVLTIERYIETSGALEEKGFFEREIAHVSETFGAVTHRFSTYDSRGRADDPAPFARGINSIQLLNDGRRWWVVTVFWDVERPNNRIPSRYLPK